MRAVSLLLAAARTIMVGDTNGNRETSDNTDNDGEGGDVIDLGDVLVVYFSATNNTEKIAGYIATLRTGRRSSSFRKTPILPTI